MFILLWIFYHHPLGPYGLPPSLGELQASAGRVEEDPGMLHGVLRREKKQGRREKRGQTSFIGFHLEKMASANPF